MDKVQRYLGIVIIGAIRTTIFAFLTILIAELYAKYAAAKTYI